MVMKTRSLDVMLDEHEPALDIPVDDKLVDRDPFDWRLPVFQIADSWGSSEDTPMGLDLRKIG